MASLSIPEQSIEGGVVLDAANYATPTGLLQKPTTPSRPMVLDIITIGRLGLATITSTRRFLQLTPTQVSPRLRNTCRPSHARSVLLRSARLRSCHAAAASMLQYRPSLRHDPSPASLIALRALSPTATQICRPSRSVPDSGIWHCQAVRSAILLRLRLRRWKRWRSLLLLAYRASVQSTRLALGPKKAEQAIGLPQAADETE